MIPLRRLLLPLLALFSGHFIAEIPAALAADCPDLTISFTGPASAAPEDEIGNLVKASVGNTGDAGADQFVLEFYLSIDEEITTSDTPLFGGQAFEEGLAAGESLSAGIYPVMQIPAGTAPGKYYLGVIVDKIDAVDECDETNNTHAIPFTVTDPCPDLTIALTGPASAAPGDTIDSLVKASVGNAGDTGAGRFALDFYLSIDREITFSDILLGLAFEDGLAAGESHSAGITPNMQIPPGITPGLYFLGVIVDRLGAVDECDETNNTQAVPIRIKGSECDPVISAEQRLYIPRLRVEASQTEPSLWAGMDLVPFNGGFAFELVGYAPNAPADESELCTPLILDSDGLIHIPRIRYNAPDGVIYLSANLRPLQEGDKTLFVIETFEILQ